MNATIDAGMNWSIGARLGGGFAVLLAVLGIFIAAVFSWLGQSERAQRELTGQVLPRTARADQVERALLETGIAARGYLYEPSPARLAEFEQSGERLREAMRGLGAADLDAEARARHEQLVPQVQWYLSESGRLLRQPESDAHAELNELREGIVAGVAAFSGAERRLGEQALAEIAANRDKIFNSLWIGSLLTLLLFAAIGLLTTQSIRRPAGALLRVATALRNGDWKPALALAPASSARENGAVRDEMRKIGHAFGAAATALEAREQRLRADGRIAAAVASTLDKGELAAAALGAVLEHVGGEVGAIYACDPDSGMLTPIARYALDDSLGALCPGEGLPGQAAKARRPVVARDIPRDTPFRVKLGYDEAPPSSVAAIPIVFQERVLGVLVAGSLRPLGAEAMDFLAAAAGQLGTGFMNVQAYEHIQQLLAEVRAKGEQIQAQNEELQAQNEEIQAQNEEIQAQNEEIQAQNEDLQRHSDAQREYAASLKQADLRKNEFLGVLAHELRNPLAPMVNGMQLLNMLPAESEEYGRTRAVIERQMHHLTRLIDDLLDVTRISRGKVSIKRERLNLVELVHECLEDQRASIESGGLALELDLPETPIRIDADYTRLCQVLSNLLANAVKFTGAGSRIRVTVSLHPGERQVAIHISDDGVGIDPALLPQIFEPFSQGESELARTKGGLGLGLALVKALIELHHGRVEARSDGPGRGAEFVLWLPLPEADDAPVHAAIRAETTPAEAISPRPRSVLVIDDNVDAAQTLAGLLQSDGYEVRLAHSAPDGLEAAAAWCPEVILCDVGLPGMDGYEFARRVRAEPAFGDVVLIAVTGYATSRDQQRAQEAGFDGHIAKPARLAQLREAFGARERRRDAPARPSPRSEPDSRDSGL